MKIMNATYYKTRDLYLSSFLLSSGELTLSGTESVGKEIYFQFTPRDRAVELAQQYWSDRAPSIQPRQLFQSLRSLKDLLFSGS